MSRAVTAQSEAMKRERSGSTTVPRETLILLVEPDQRTRDHVAGWLGEAGYSVIDCPGPRREDYTCLGVRGERCALVEMADVAVLDAGVFRQAGDDRSAASRLLRYYLTADRPLILVSDTTGGSVSFEDDRVALVRCDRESVLQAVIDLMDVNRRASAGLPTSGLSERSA